MILECSGIVLDGHRESVMILDGPGWSWMVLDVLDRPGWPWIVLDTSGTCILGPGWSWVVLDGPGWSWIVLDGLG